ncbi:hypothetical protein GOP47_0026244, partial [Adiantum capillus-veneris]
TEAQKRNKTMHNNIISDSTVTSPASASCMQSRIQYVSSSSVDHNVVQRKADTNNLLKGADNISNIKIRSATSFYDGLGLRRCASPDQHDSSDTHPAHDDDNDELDLISAKQRILSAQSSLLYRQAAQQLLIGDFSQQKQRQRCS